MLNACHDKISEDPKRTLFFCDYKTNLKLPIAYKNRFLK